MGGISNPGNAATLTAAFAKAPATQALVSRLGPGDSCTLPGISEGARAFWVAALRHALPRRPILVVTEGTKAQEAFFQDLQTWLGSAVVPATPSAGASEGSPDRAGTPADGSSLRGDVRLSPLFYPDWEILPHESKLPHVDVISERLATLIALDAAVEAKAETETDADAAPDTSAKPGSRRAPLVVASVVALLQKTFAPAELTRRLRRLRQGDSWDPLDLIEWLEEQGYEPEAQVTQKGTLSLRGGIVDVWPPAEPWPVRLEFFGDELESLRQFDPLTQLTRDRIQEVLLGPAGEFGILKRSTPDPATGHLLGTLLDHLPEGTLIVLSDPERIHERASLYAEQVPATDPLLASWKDLLTSAQSRGDSLLELHDTLEETGDVARHEAGTVRMTSLESFRPLGTRMPEPAVADAQRREFFQQLHRWLRSGLEVHVFCNNAGERDRFSEIWAEYGLATSREREQEQTAAPPKENHGLMPQPQLHLGALSRGFLAEDAGFVVVTDAEIFGRYKVLRPRRLKSPHAQSTKSLLDIDFTEFEDGDLVVHVEHGIGRFLGLQMTPSTPGHRGASGGPGQECLVIEYAAANPADPPPKLYVPVSEAHLVTKYVGAGKARPPLNTLGGTRWAKARKDAEHAVADLAAELLEVQAARESQEGHAFPADTSWQREFEASFLFEETPDQARAIDAAKADMERARPMDRLICGDVGFGKTEVAIRAAFKAVMGGKQVAVLVPTTILAQQHFNTFRERMSDYPIRIELLSRFRSRRDQRRVVEQVGAGAVDIVIGTHRLIQKDVVYKDLGLVVVDEEQRFGVLHKERFKMLRRSVDVLTLSATPIPRTLYLALSGARDMSTIETPPQDRLPIETIVSAYDERLVRDAILRELQRQGQVFFLHNRVHTIDSMAVKLRALVPDARIVVGHGQMDPDELEEIMTRFVAGEADVLLSTTIVESGLDIPNANTIIIDRADRFGLSELYQLRGRVGRYKNQAYAYLLIPRHAQLLAEARKRISAIRQYSSLGSGFRIAMRDLEIRGAGNILGPQQSGHITAVGFDLYCQLLKQSISVLKGEKLPPRVEVQIRLDFIALNPAEEGLQPTPAPRGAPGDRETRGARTQSESSPTRADPKAAVAGLPSNYLPDPKQRIEIHRRLAQVAVPADLRRLKEDLRDRFGPLPPPVELLLQVAELRLFAAALGVNSIESRDDKLMLQREGNFIQVGGRFPRLSKKDPRARLQEIRRFLGALATGPDPARAPARRT